MSTVKVLSYTGRFIQRQLHYDFMRQALYVTIGQQDWWVEQAGATHFRCIRRRFRPATSTPQEATNHAAAASE
jgi:hypothetical protein